MKFENTEVDRAKISARLKLEGELTERLWRDHEQTFEVKCKEYSDVWLDIANAIRQTAPLPKLEPI